MIIGAASQRLTEIHLPCLFQQLKERAYKWKEIGLHLGFRPGELSNIEGRLALIQGGPVSFLEALLEEWIQWAPNDSRGSTNFATLTDLATSLRDAELGAAAHDLDIV